MCSCPLPYQVPQAGLFSAVNSAFVIDIHSKLQPDPNEQSTALLRAILLTLNKSAIPNETPAAPPTQETPPGIVLVTGLMYSSLLISLLAAFIAMLGKQWLNRYMRHTGGSMIDRCGDRQRKCDGLKKWPFHLFIESLPMMLQIALLLLTCGLCRYMVTINTSVAGVLIALTVAGAVFYLGVIIAGTSSYECPFQTPVSIALRSLWKKIAPQTTLTFPPVFTACASLYGHVQSYVLTTFQQFWEDICFLCKILYLLVWPPFIQMIYHPQNPPPPNPPLPVAQPRPQDASSLFPGLHGFWEIVRHPTHHITHCQPQSYHPSTISDNFQWLTATALVTLYRINANDVRCISWILWNITDAEVLDVAIQLAAIVRWFEDGVTVEPPFDLLFSIFHACFDSTGRVYPGLRDRAYYSARAILWIHILAMCKSEDLTHRFSLPTIPFSSMSIDGNLSDLLCIYHSLYPHSILCSWQHISTDITPAHTEWISNALLHLAWAKRNIPQEALHFTNVNSFPEHWNLIPLNAALNHLLTWCITLDWPIDEEVLKIQDKSYVIQ